MKIMHSLFSLLMMPGSFMIIFLKKMKFGLSKRILREDLNCILWVISLKLTVRDTEKIICMVNSEVFLF